MKSGKTPQIVFLLSHPIQYFSPMLADLAGTWGDRFEVWYCSDAGLKAHHDSEFGVTYQWDIPLLEGYASRFFPNRSPKPSVSAFSGLFNPGLIAEIFRRKPEILILHGWGYPTHILAILAARLTGTRVWLRAETPANQENMKTGFRQNLKKFLLRQFIFRQADRFLFIGSRNRLFFEQFGARPEQLIFTPYAVDHRNFHPGTEEVKAAWKSAQNIPENHVTVLFCGKLIHKKRPDLLLEASRLLSDLPHTLVIAGDGEMKPALTEFAEAHSLSVRFLGFQNQTQIPAVYAGCDLFVLPSTLGETWGLVVNEAMASGLPVITSDTTGCSADLVETGVNGDVFPDGNAQALAACLRPFLMDPELRRSAGRASLDRISGYTIGVITQNLTGAEAGK